MDISVIIITFNRKKELNECLNSILSQKGILPKEVIVVDNYNKVKIINKAIIDSIINKFNERSIILKYLTNDRENSLTVARNMGAKNATGDIILFLDDDVFLDNNYLKEILNVYEKYPDTLGVQGYIILNNGSFQIKNILSRIFCLGYRAKNKCCLLVYNKTVYPYPLDEVIGCQWLSGANHSYKRQILEEFAYDEQLKKYSEGEDIDFSYRVYKKYPGSLYITPYATLKHKVSKSGRISSKELIFMKEVYGLYLFYKNYNQSLTNKVVYIWSRAMNFVFIIISIIFFRSSFVEAGYLVNSYILCIKHIKDIKRGNLNFFNRNLD